MPGYLRPFLLGCCCSAAVVGAGLLLPIWTRTKEAGGCVVVHESVPVWRGLTEPSPVPGLVESQSTREANRDICLILLTVAGTLGARLFWECRPRTSPAEAPDYTEGPDGSVRDGRSAA